MEEVFGPYRGIDLYLFTFILIISALTYLIIFLITRKGEQGKIVGKPQQFNGAIIAAAVTMLFPPFSFFIALPLLYIGRSYMRYSYQKGRGLSIFLLILCWGGLAFTAATTIGTYLLAIMNY